MNHFSFSSSFFSTCLLLVSTSCVMQTKYNALRHTKESLQTEMIACSDALVLSDDKNSELRTQNSTLEADVTKLNKVLSDLNIEHSTLTKEHESLSKGYDNTVKNTGKLNYSIQTQQKEIQEMRAQLELSIANNTELGRNLASREKRVSELEELIAKQRENAKELKIRVDEALVDFELNDINVKVRNGQVYVSLSDKLLFGSGSVVVDPKGKEALSKLAKIVSIQDDFDIVVEGHTDNVPISKFSKYMNDNWDLSVSRATAIVRILIKSGVTPQIIHATGRGQYTPVVNNDTKDSRQKNRRIEIILQPKMAEFYNVLGSHQL